ncbi:MAG TPA: CRISPR-associated ring nuclease, partial [Ktedonobacteraceae bacterium]|nr:CRISPR-associated ring nuclease [Ktedonobacteraceae bacterium]
MSKYIHTLLATLGGQPQVVTFTLDLLIQRGFPINEVVVVHPKASHSRLQHSLDCLNAEFVGDRYQTSGQTIHLRSHILQLDDEPLDDIVDEVSADGALNTIHQLIRSLKRQHRCIHLSITGGRRLMSSISTEAALLNFSHSDHIWHIYTPEAVQRQASEGSLMHVPSQSNVHLIERHFVPWGAYFSDLSQSVSTAQETSHFQKRKIDSLERTCCDQVAQKATERQLDVLRAFAEGLNIQEVAERLCITTKTVDAHKTRLLELCREVWAIEQSASRLGYHFLYKTFAPY